MAAVQKRKIRWAISLVLVMLYFSCLTAEAQYGGGSGEPNDPYLIYTAEQMNAIGADANDWDKHFKLMADIDLAAYTGTDFNIIGYWLSYSDNKPFTGVFDGNGKKISNFSYTSTDVDSIALFSYVEGKNARIKDLGLIDPNVDAGTGNWVGSLVDYLEHGTVTGCYAQGGSVSGDWGVGGLVGYNSGTITNSYSAGSVLGTTNIGGLVGYNGGSITTSNITTSYSTGSVTGEERVGGLVGISTSTITTSYSTGTVSGNDSVGGLVGDNSGGSITTSYSTGAVNGNYSVGGLVGSGGRGILHSVWDMETSGLTVSDGGVGLTTAEMMDPYMLGLNGFANDPNWVLDAGRDYPRLAWEGTAGQSIPDDWFDGQGTEEEPYRVDMADQLMLLRGDSTLWDKHFILGADINLDPNLQGREVFSQAVIQVFSGVFDGNGHAISHLTITGGSYLGLFGKLVSGATISNLGLEAVDVNGTSYVGGLVGDNYDGTITDCYATGSVSGNNRVGGLVGDNYDGTITDCYATGSVSGDSRVGGLVGYNDDGPISDCYSSGDVSGNWYVGGLVGYNDDGTITNCYATGSVSGDNRVGGLVGDNWGSITESYSTGAVSGNSWVGGLVGENYRTITDCYATGSVSGDNRVGGLVGYNDDGPISDCYSSGDVSGNWYVGGLVGDNYDGTITNCYATGSVSGDNRVGGLVGLNSGNITTSHSTATVSGYDRVGGLVGYNYGTITTSYSTGTVSGNWLVGGLVGWNSSHGTIVNCYATGSVDGTWWDVGGLVGSNQGSITTSYSTGTVSGNQRVGGLVGRNFSNGTIVNCYSSGNVSGADSVGGLVGRKGKPVVSSFWDIQTSGQVTSDGGIGKTTSEMQTESTFTDAGWNFVGVWSICEGTNYPRFVWQIPAGDFVCPDGITIDDFVFFAEYWGNETCDLSNDYCQGTDLDFSGTVDEADFEILIENWLESSN